MNKIKLNLFELFSLSWIVIALSGLFWALLGLFYIQLVILDIIALLGIIWYLQKKGTIEICPLAKSSKIILLSLFFIGTLLSLTTTPTIFGGRDEGSYSDSAILLSQDGKLEHSSPLEKQFFGIYGPGKALNFPGFNYTQDGNLKSQFLPAYPAWIAVWYTFFGLKGIQFVNLLPFVTFLFSFYLILKKFLQKIPRHSENHLEKSRSKKKISTKTSLPIIGLLLFLSTFPLMIFYKFTLSEVFFGSLCWFALYLTYRYFDAKSYLRYFLIFFPLALMLFSRIEAGAIIFALLLIFILKDFNRFRMPKYQLIFVLLGILFLLSLATSSNFYVDSFKNVAEPFLGTAKDPQAVKLISDDMENFFLIKVFLNYNILFYLIMSVAYIAMAIKNKKGSALLPLIYFSPTLIYLVDANISLDQPWMLRRFIFSIIPLLILYSVLFLANLYFKKTASFSFLSIRSHLSQTIPTLIIFLILALNFLLFFPFAPESKNLFAFSQNQGLLEKTRQISDLFQPNDLVLVSQKSSGSGWSLMSEPMRLFFGKQAIYFFNPKDLKKINTEEYGNVYLITSENELSLYEGLPKEQISEYTISNQLLAPLKNPSAKPEILEFETKGKVFKINK